MVESITDNAQTQHINTLLQFLNAPLDCGDEVFARFAALPGVVIGKGPDALQRYVYIPGTRKDRVVLVAHIDTVWDKAYKQPFSESRSVIFEDGIFRSGTQGCGIGADDRAGCAILWELQSCGHSILLVDGEEHGKHGAKYLKTSNKKLFRELNRHRYMIEFDCKGTNSCLFNQVDNTGKFKQYIEKELGFIDSKTSGGCDLQILCKSVCGVNLSVGYRFYHKPEEQLILSEWENTLNTVRAFLENPQRKFHTRIVPRYARFIKRCIRKAGKIFLSVLPKKKS